MLRMLPIMRSDEANAFFWPLPAFNGSLQIQWDLETSWSCMQPATPQSEVHPTQDEGIDSQVTLQTQRPDAAMFTKSVESSRRGFV
jgi:hypothetical protein